MSISVHVDWKGRRKDEKTPSIYESRWTIPMALWHIFDEAFANEGSQVAIPGVVLQSRLDHTLANLNKYYKFTCVEQYRDLVEFCVKKEQEVGEPVHFWACS